MSDKQETTPSYSGDLYRLREKVREAQRELFNRAHDLLPPRTPVWYYHGSNVIEAEVVCVIGHAGSPGVRVRNTMTGKEYNLDLSRLILRGKHD